ncbi:MAG TPA: hypothetical protein VFK05_13050 [Polyangiaceae bacterium]|nr:hypothetical protein [Polyangiaceae bacterium]
MSNLVAFRRPLRLLLITLGLAVAGALFGGLAGAAALAIALSLDPHWPFASFEYCQVASAAQPPPL